MKINEVDPRNFDSDVDYYAALNAKPKARTPGEPRLSPAQQDAEDEDSISQQRQAQHKAFTQKRAVKYVDQEGSAPNGEKYNKLYVIQAQDAGIAAHEEYMFDKHEWGAKKVVDVKKEKNEDGTVTHTLFIVDNHKYGMWKPFKGKSAVKEESHDSPVASAITRRILMQRADLLAKHGPAKVTAAIDDVADFVGDVEEIGSSDVSAWVKQVEQALNGMGESVNGEYDDEAGMAKSNLRTMARAVNGLIDTIGDNDNLPEWAQEKIAKAEMMTTGVWDYLLSQKEQGMDPQVEGKQTNIKEADMDSEQGRQNILSILKAAEQGQDAQITVGDEPITLDASEARFVSGRYKAFMKAGRQEEFLRALTDARAFDRIMAKMRATLDKQKNFRGSIPGERGVEEGIVDTIKSGAKKAFDKLGGGSDEELLQRLEKETGGQRPEKKDNRDVKDVDEALFRASAQLKDNQYFCMMDKQVKLIPEGYKRNQQGYPARK